MVLYRKYRPQIIAELDKEDIKSRLAAIFSSDNVPHAFLFSGPKGTGKTSAARIVAKVLNCEKNKLGSKTIEPCNLCSNCQAVTSGVHIDVLEIDAASNRGIDEIRALRERISLVPGMGKMRVYIIDEVHMLTKEAFNALLKTLEEPPVHVVFILATTEPHKLPETIISRCVQLTFAKASADELLHSLNRVVAGEKVKVDKAVLEEIVRASDGSFRDAVKLLEQALVEGALSLGKIKILLGRHANDYQLLAYLSKYQSKEALAFVQKQLEEGVDIKHMTESLLERLQRMLLATYGIKNDEDDLIDVKMKPAEIKRLIELLSRAYLEMKTSFIESLPLELAIIGYCSKPA